METYKDIEGYEGIYQISDLGNVWSHRLGRELTITISKTGQYRVPLQDGYREWWLVSRLVYRAFNGPLIDGLEIDHDDHDKSNNRPGNLKQITHKQNTTEDKKPISGIHGVHITPSGKFRRKIPSTNRYSKSFALLGRANARWP